MHLTLPQLLPCAGAKRLPQSTVPAPINIDSAVELAGLSRFTGFITKTFKVLLKFY